jgi:hypothetical protein
MPRNAASPRVSLIESMWTRAEVAKYLGMHPRSTYQQRGLQLLAVRITSRMTRFDPVKVRAWWAAREAAIRGNGKRGKA